MSSAWALAQPGHLRPRGSSPLKFADDIPTHILQSLILTLTVAHIA